MKCQLIIACVAVLATILPAQSAEQRLDAVAEFKRFFPKYRATAERVAAVQTLEGMDCAAAVAQLLELLGDRDPEVVRSAAGVLAGYREPASFAEVCANLPDLKDQNQRSTLIRVLTNANQVQALPSLVTIAIEDRRASPAVRYEVARALGILVGEHDVAPALEKLLGDREAPVRMSAAEAIGKRRLADLVSPLLPLLDDKSWQVRSAAIGALGLLRRPEAVEPLIDKLDSAGRLEEEIADALFRITALDFGRDAELWRNQWTRLQDIGWRIPTEEELAKARESRKRADALYGRTEERNEFAGIPTSSTRVLFIIDVSGSMDDMVVEREKFDAGYDDFRKLTIVKTELRRTIDGLSKDTLFNIVSFATDLKVWKKYLVPANIVNKSSATSWTDRLQPLGGTSAAEGAAMGGAVDLSMGKTNTFAALMYPFGIDPKKAGAKGPLDQVKAVTKSKLDTVFFLSDGRPSTGRIVDTEEILTEVARVNEASRLVIHTIAIGDFQKAFLRRLAETNHGVFVDLGR